MALAIPRNQNESFTFKAKYTWKNYYRSVIGLKNRTYFSKIRPRPQKAKTQERGGFAYNRPRSPSQPFIRHKSNGLAESDLFPYMPIFNSQGEQYAYFYEGNLFSSDGSYWFGYYQYYKCWKVRVVNGLDGFPEGIFYYNLGGLYHRGRVGPNRRYILYPKPPVPPRPPIPPREVTWITRHNGQTPTKTFDMSIWSNRKEPVGPYQRAADCIHQNATFRDKDALQVAAYNPEKEFVTNKPFKAKPFKPL